MIEVRSIPAWSPEAYDRTLPPPLCFTDPAGEPSGNAPMMRGGVTGLTPRPPKMMMDPTDRSTWQRPYRFT